MSESVMINTQDAIEEKCCTNQCSKNTKLRIHANASCAKDKRLPFLNIQPLPLR